MSVDLVKYDRAGTNPVFLEFMTVKEVPKGNQAKILIALERPILARCLHRSLY